MTRERSLVAVLSLLVGICMAVAAVMTLAHVWDFAQDCEATGGTFSNDGGTAWCRH